MATTAGFIKPQSSSRQGGIIMGPAQNPGSLGQAGSPVPPSN